MEAKIFSGAEEMLSVVVMACFIVLCAMVIDLISGLAKAKQRGEIRSSWGLKRSLNKFIMYEGGMLIAAGIDVLMHASHIYQLVRLEAIYGIPIITCLLGVFLLVVEFFSVREKADEKTRTEMSRVAELAEKMVHKDELVDALTKAIINAKATASATTVINEINTEE
ncbi:MAG: phage holin family protein [Lachnospiraceae bacterium]|nr:phage holin family protein [Lachnospiraceae bacterium]MCM1516020.1 phage holin family protein [Paraprevotella sp.]